MDGTHLGSSVSGLVAAVAVIAFQGGLVTESSNAARRRTPSRKPSHSVTRQLTSSPNPAAQPGTQSSQSECESPSSDEQLHDPAWHDSDPVTFDGEAQDGSQDFHEMELWSCQHQLSLDALHEMSEGDG